MEARFATLNRYIILLVDNATCHIIDDPDKYPHIRVHFLPPNTTAHLQPMDAGIIQAFKAHYKKFYLQLVIQEFESGNDNPSNIDVLQAIRIIDRAWHAISMETIMSCWRHTAILPRQPGEPPRSHDLPSDDNNRHDDNDERLANDGDVPECVRRELLALERDAQDSIQESLLNDANLQACACEYVENCDEIDIEEVLSDQRIIELVCNSSSEDSQTQPVADDDEHEPGISFVAAKAHLNEILRFFKQQPASFAKDHKLDVIQALHRRIHEASPATMAQSTLHDFFSPK